MVVAYLAQLWYGIVAKDDDVEQDRRHAALYGGDRMYCKCGEKLHFNEYGSYCPVCDPQDPSDMYDDDME